MITTREINVDLSKRRKLGGITTKKVDASLKVKLPKKPVKAKGVSTTTLSDVADIAEKKRRHDIAVEKKLAVKDEKKILLINNEGDSAVAFIDEGGFKKLNIQFTFVEIDGLVQAISRKELK